MPRGLRDAHEFFMGAWGHRTQVMLQSGLRSGFFNPSSGEPPKGPKVGQNARRAYPIPSTRLRPRLVVITDN
jgi:hypothetical protein